MGSWWRTDDVRDPHQGNEAQSRSSRPRDTYRAQAESEEHNPFVAFRTAVDDHFRGMFSGFGFPSAFGHDEMRRVQDSLRKTEIAPLLDASTTLAYSPVSQEALDSARTLILQARDACAHDGVRPDRIQSLYADDSADPINVWGLIGLPWSTNPWLSVRWFSHSPYSPTRLETEQHCHQYGSMWRAAFEDLMCESLGKKMHAHDAWTNKVNNQRLYSAWAASARDWMLGLQCRGILPPQLPSLYQLPSRSKMDAVFGHVIFDRHVDLWTQLEALGAKADLMHLAYEIGSFDEDETRTPEPTVPMLTPTTEMDLYERFLGQANGTQSYDTATTRQSSPNTTSPTSMSGSNLTSQQHGTATPRPLTPEEASRSKILSTLSTTETTTLPDGTVTTKVVMKRRFADGREESSETVSSTHGDPSTGRDARANDAASPDVPKKQNAQSCSWFWS